MGLYNPYPARKTVYRALPLAAGLLAAVAAAAHTRFVVHGQSMTPTLRPGDHLVVRRWPRGLAAGALVVVADPRHPRRLVVKRVTSVEEAGVTVRGDNPTASTDSRTYGMVPRAAVRGRVVYRYAPRERVGRVPGTAYAAVR